VSLALLVDVVAWQPAPQSCSSSMYALYLVLLALTYRQSQ
jgi:hypothetical protein